MYAPDVLVISHADRDLVGRSIAELAGSGDPFDTVCELAAADPLAGVVVNTMAEYDVRQIMASPLVTIGSDNAPPDGLQHPRTWGCFPLFPGCHVRERGVLSWERAIHKATALPARQFRLADRGAVLPGWTADLIAFDPGRIGHADDYLRPDTPVTGLHHVILGGQVVVKDGTLTGERSGTVLRHRPFHRVKAIRAPSNPARPGQAQRAKTRVPLFDTNAGPPLSWHSGADHRNDPSHHTPERGHDAPVEEPSIA